MTPRTAAADEQTWGLQVERRTQRTGYVDTWTDVRRASASFLIQSGTGQVMAKPKGYSLIQIILHWVIAALGLTGLFLLSLSRALRAFRKFC